MAVLARPFFVSVDRFYAGGLTHDDKAEILGAIELGGDAFDVVDVTSRNVNY